MQLKATNAILATIRFDTDCAGTESSVKQVAVSKARYTNLFNKALLASSRDLDEASKTSPDARQALRKAENHKQPAQNDARYKKPKATGHRRKMLLDRGSLQSK